MSPKSERSERKSPTSTSPSSGGRRGRLVAQGIFLVVAIAFVVLSTVEVERQVFGAPIRTPQTNPNCSYLLDAFDEAVTRGLEHAASAHTPAKAEEAFENVVSPPLAAIEKHCTAAGDRDAFATASRLRDVAEATVDAQQTAIAPLRAAIQARRNP